MIIKTIHDYNNLCKQKQYVFRGQSNKDWSLLPRTYRCDSNINCPAIEKESVDRFIRHLQENGYRGFTGELNQFDFLTRRTEIFPTEETLPYLALAQHYAFDSQFPWLRTSLLDVTHNLDIAAYFAVEENKENASDGKIFVFDSSTIKEPYKYYEPLGCFRLEARLIIQECAFIYRIHKCEHMDEYQPYKNKTPFDDIVIDTIIISKELKPQLKDHLQKKLFELFMYPRLILGQVTPNLATAGFHSYEELKKLNAPAVNRAEKLGDKHYNY
jgi:hypothetical protein